MALHRVAFVSGLLMALCTPFGVRAACPFAGKSGASSSTWHKPASHPLTSSDPAPSPSPEWAGSIPGSTNDSDPFVFMNDFFHSVYSDAGVAMRPSPLVILEDDYLVLEYNSSRVVEPFISMVYHNLKMVDHVPLAVFMIVLPEVTAGSANPDASVNLSAGTLATLTKYASLAAAARQNLVQFPSRFQAGEQLQRQFSIFDATLSFVNTTLMTGQTSQTELYSTVYSILPLVTANINEASADAVNRLFTIMEDWRENVLSAAEFAALRVIATTSPLARRASMYTQFFARYFNVVPEYNSRFVTLDPFGTPTTEAAVFDVLDSYVTDAAIGDGFFKDHWRMQQDALCEGAKLALDALFPASANTTQGCFVDPPYPDNQGLSPLFH